MQASIASSASSSRLESSVRDAGARDRVSAVYSSCLAHDGLSSCTVPVIVEIITLEVGGCQGCQDVLSLAVGPMACGRSRS